MTLASRRRFPLHRRLGAGLGLALLGAGALAGPADDLHTVLADHDRLAALADPVGTGQRGDLDAARRWPDNRPDAVAARARALAGLHERLKAIPAGELGGADALNHTLLSRQVALDLEAQAFDEARIPFKQRQRLLPCAPLGGRGHAAQERRRGRGLADPPGAPARLLRQRGGQHAPGAAHRLCPAAAHRPGRAAHDADPGGTGAAGPRAAAAAAPPAGDPAARPAGRLAAARACSW